MRRWRTRRQHPANTSSRSAADAVARHWTSPERRGRRATARCGYLRSDAGARCRTRGDRGAGERPIHPRQRGDPPGCADLMFFPLGAMFFGDPLAAFANLRASLKPGGRMVLAAPRTARIIAISASRCKQRDRSCQRMQSGRPRPTSPACSRSLIRNVFDPY